MFKTALLAFSCCVVLASCGVPEKGPVEKVPDVADAPAVVATGSVGEASFSSEAWASGTLDVLPAVTDQELETLIGTVMQGVNLPK